MPQTLTRRLPVTDDPDTEGFWQAAAEGRLKIRQCRSCSTYVHLPRNHCPKCHAPETVWHEVSSRGTLYSFCIAEQQIDPAFPTPYTAVLVELEDAPGVRLIGHLPGRHDLTIGMQMVIAFDKLGDDVTLPQWHPAQTDRTVL
ncbi:Zn-ribbon domain-containing OB-fold protein [Rhodococcus opacus]|uniref:Zn-ribbon domain-containing OB-fold protein n=1 Tax=Rhodococcus opacus TaxID=37919 RepID=UPI001F465DE3|nr:zinc ribbon domain-containing protein [Rhodococcus opacus]